ncbi:hypothetical protein CY34DRAFT_807942, partial [Suillus luteus UH-Slu-Lm8-n1]
MQLKSSSGPLGINDAVPELQNECREAGGTQNQSRRSGQTTHPVNIQAMDRDGEKEM